MVQVLKSLGFEYVAANPGSSFRSLHESLVNFGGNINPEFLTCCHEESAVAMGDGYARIEGKPLAVCAHSTVGLQHASMAIYNAYAGRVPVFLVLGNTVDITLRRNLGDWDHSAQDAAAMVRDYTKWDDLPASLTQFAESAVRAYRIAMTPPMGPVVLVADSGLQESPVPETTRIPIPKLTLMSPPAGDSAAVNEIARLLMAAEMPVIVAERAVRTAAGMKLLVELAETLQAPVTQGKFPTDHPLSHPDGKVIADADVVLGMEVNDLWGAVHVYRDQLHGSARSLIRPGVKLLSISPNELYIKSNYQNFQRFTDPEVNIAADAETTMPALIEACKRLLTADRKNAIAERGRRLTQRHAQAREQARQAATLAWDASPVSWQRLFAEVWELMKDQDWALVGGQPSRLWRIDRHYQTMGVTGSGGAGGVGFTAPASVGAALAHRKHGRLCVSIQSDGDLLYAPGVLWTAAHHRIPLLIVMHNNRAYHQEVMHVQRMANRHQRGIENARTGTTLTNPDIDFAAIAKGMGVYSEGPISAPKDLAAALRRGVDVVRKGEPALVDVVTQPR
ncbi:MAG TPA: thiamine pyrophosphate-dependent enzyme [Bryobacteraceae bacterium]|jgi:thiamine pyrophosphate-dependent acetolactate synthase large subunit-like protein|nr:thiamine pyrophosphate-dependent enzyme [Bryobacteraceae bacterium]